MINDLVTRLHSEKEDEVLRALEELDVMLRQGGAGAENIRPLCDLLSRGKEIRSKALWCLGKLGQNKIAHPSTVALVAAHTRDELAEDRENAAWALGEMAGAGVGDESGLGSLIQLLHDEDLHVRGMAAWSIGRYADKLRICDTESIGPLQNMSEGTSPYLRKSAEFALERISSARQ